VDGAGGRGRGGRGPGGAAVHAHAHGIAAGLLAAYLGVGATSARGPRGVLHLAAQVPGFLAWKLGVYGRMAGGRAPTGWERTPREARATTTGG